MSEYYTSLAHRITKNTKYTQQTRAHSPEYLERVVEEIDLVVGGLEGGGGWYIFG